MALLLAATLPLTAYATEADPDARIQKLEQMMQKMLQQRAEQDKQMQIMAEELKAMQQQMAQGKEHDLKERGKSTGQPVLANFQDGVSFEDDSGNWKLAINGRVQADARAFDPDESAADTFSVRRARLGATMTLYQDYVVRVEGEYSGNSTSMTYGYFDINKFKQAKIRLGQFKPLYGLERSTSTNFTDFQERSMADALLGSTYDRGIMLHGAPVGGMYYSAAYLNGNNGDESDTVRDSKDLMARLTGNVAEFAGWKDAVVHVGGFYASGRQEGKSSIPTLQTEARGYKFFETADATANKFTDAVDRTREGIELALARDPVKLQGEYIRTEFDGRGFDRDLSAWYASVNWLATGESFAAAYKDGAFGRIRPKNNFKSGGAGWGALQLGIRYSSFDGADFVTGNLAGTGKLAANKSNGVDAWTLGANWILNPNVRLVANYIHTSFDDTLTVSGERYDDEDALTMRAQFDF
jgi:phosphate-selective porin OprO/OprP